MSDEVDKSITRTVTLDGKFISNRESLFLKGLEVGLPPAAAAAKAGYENPTATARALMLRTHIQNEVALIQARMVEASGVSRQKVFKMLKQAYDIAVAKEDAAAIVRVASEINKMSGFYTAPGANAVDKVKTLESAMTIPDTEKMSDEELAALAEAQDGELNGG